MGDKDITFAKMCISSGKNFLYKDNLTSKSY